MKLTTENKQALDFGLPIGLGALVFYNIYKGKGDYKQAGIVALITAAIAYVIVTQATKSIVLATADKLSTSQKVDIANKYGGSTAQVTAAQDRAKKVHIAFYGPDGSAWTEDEAQAIAAVNTAATPVDVQMTCEAYNANYGKSLKADFDEFVNFWDGNISPIVKANWF
jgi:hypothetical protein